MNMRRAKKPPKIENEAKIAPITSKSFTTRFMPEAHNPAAVSTAQAASREAMIERSCRMSTEPKK